MNVKCHQNFSIIAEFSMSKLQAKSDIITETEF